ncbi:hypothetical protein FHS29_005179 [Saccharothrix tamanrassetensis]|uniref:Lipoprotein n=1 Tax=Saccharothrix tamanrassetensis TaxID=1051531 RepID=A0A841CLX8_9PSEU|nr:hypothetical protein [Saccharothrix tamanrassetensis]MBB5958571.1 hypothetical protein [Saccharothrix tamanrassetensis]
MGRTWLLTAGALVCALLGGCGASDRPGLDQDGDLGSIGTATGEAGAREAARAYLDAWSSGNSTVACGLLTAAKAREFGAKLGDGTCPAAFAGIRDRMSESARKSYADVQIAEVKVNDRADGGQSAVVRLSQKLDGPLNGDDDFSWRYESGRWLTKEDPEG